MKEIFKRKSIRKYTDEDVSDEIVNQLLRAAMQAPSGKNQQPWEFIVVRDREKLEQMSQTAAPHPYHFAAKKAPVTILLVANMEKVSLPETWQQDMAAATENLLLEAVYLGLGAVWLGVAEIDNRAEYIKSIFQLPDTIKPFAMVPVGYPVAPYSSAVNDRFDEGRIHYEEW